MIILNAMHVIRNCADRPTRTCVFLSLSLSLSFANSYTFCIQMHRQTNNVNNYNSNILNSMRERIVPILLRQQRKNCNAIDTFLYSILPWIVMAFMMMISFVLFLYVARGACMIMPLLSTVTGQPTISWQPIVGAAVATPTKTNRGTAIP